MEETIKEKRLRAGISRAEMSRILDIPIRTLENWESGTNRPPEWAEKMIIEKLNEIQLIHRKKNAKHEKKKADYNKMIQSVKDFYNEKKREYTEYKNKMLEEYSEILKNEDDLELCRRIYQTRYFLKNNRKFDDDAWALDVAQAYRTMFNCQKIIFGNKISEECLEKIKAYDEIKDNMEVAKEYLNVESAIVINGHVFARLIKTGGGADYEFFALSSVFDSDLHEYTNADYETDESEKEKAFEYWKNHGMM